MCPKGMECNRDVCITCSACHRGFYKDFTGTEDCKPCPMSTYNAAEGAVSTDQCLPCRPGSTTEGHTGSPNASACVCNLEFYYVPTLGAAARPGVGACVTCPKGAVCPTDGACSLHPYRAGVCLGEQVLGVWTLEAGTGLGRLLSCPAGTEKVTAAEAGRETLQECLPCATDTEYILRPDVGTCNRCPEGLVCRGDAFVVPVVPGSVWEAVGDDYLLRSCPHGYFVFGGAGVEVQNQKCVPCGKGEECDQDVCVTCTPCKKGYYKQADGIEDCVPCDANTYNTFEGATDAKTYCQPCPPNSGTFGAVGRTEVQDCTCVPMAYLVLTQQWACEECPIGGLCPTSGACAFQERDPALWCAGDPAGGVVGNWSVASNGKMQLDHCPAGHQRMAQVDMMRCKKCETCADQGADQFCRTAEYIINPDTDVCKRPPIGAEADGSSIRTVGGLDERGALWVADEGGEYYLKRCPTGFQIINFTGYMNQICIQCRPNEYILRSDDPTKECHPCPESAVCPNGGPPVFGTGVSTSLTLSGPSAAALAQGGAAAQPLLNGMASAVNLHPALLSLVSSSPVTSRRLAAPLMPLHDGVHLWQTTSVTFVIRMLVPNEPGQPPSQAAAALAATLSGSSFAANIGAALSAAGIDAQATGVSAAIPETELEKAGWTYIIDSDGAPVLISCPVGYLLVNSSLVEQTCKVCTPNTYSLDPEDTCGGGICGDRTCTRCPQGAFCGGKDNFQPLVADSMWELQHFYIDDVRSSLILRISECPAGYVIVRSEQQPQFDRCVICPVGFYSLEIAKMIPTPPVASVLSPEVLVGNEVLILSVTASLERNNTLCLPCPKGAECNGGSRIDIHIGHWRTLDMICPASACTRVHCDPRYCELPATGRRQVGASLQDGTALECRQEDECRLRLDVHECPIGACVSNGTCREGHTGVVCGICQEQYALQGGLCTICPQDVSGIRVGVIVFFGVLFFLIWYGQLWRPLLQRMKKPMVEAFDQRVPSPVLLWIKAHLLLLTDWAAYTKVQVVQWIRQYAIVDMAKIIIGFFQVLSTFPKMFTIQWPDELTDLFSGSSSVSNFDVAALPGIACLAEELSYFHKLMYYTLIPIGVMVLFYVPVFVAGLAGLAFYKGWTNYPTYYKVLDKFWWTLQFFMFLIYPVCSISSLKTFHCNDELGLLYGDYRQPCVGPTSSPALFIYGLVASVVFPIGIPAFLIMTLYFFGVPAMAKAKKEKALMGALLTLYKKTTSSREIEVITRTLGDPDDEGFDIRVSKLFHQIDEDGSGFIDVAEMTQAFVSMGLERTTEKSVRMMMETFGVSHEGEISQDMFSIVCKTFAKSANLFTGHEELEDLTCNQLNALYNHNWRKDMSAGGAQSDQPPKRGSTTILSADFSSRRKSVDAATTGDGQVRIFDGLDRTSSGWRSTSVLFRRNKGRPRLSEDGMRKWVMQKAYKMDRQKRLQIPTIRWDGSMEGESVALERIGAVFRPFKVEYWYFEPAFILIQKLIMTSILSFLLYGRPAQIAVGFLIVWASMTFVLVARPWADPAVNGMAAYAYCAHSLTLFYGIMLVTQDAIGEQAESVVLPWLIFILNVSVALYPVYIFLGRVSIRDMSFRLLVALFPKTMRRSKEKEKADDIETGGQKSRGVLDVGEEAEANATDGVDMAADVALGAIGEYVDSETSSRQEATISPDGVAVEAHSGGPTPRKTPLPQGLSHSKALQRLLDEAKAAGSSLVSAPESPYTQFIGHSEPPSTYVNSNGAPSDSWKSSDSLRNLEAKLVGEIVSDTPGLTQQNRAQADLQFPPYQIREDWDELREDWNGYGGGVRGSSAALANEGDLIVGDTQFGPESTADSSESSVEGDSAKWRQDFVTEIAD